MTTWVDTFRSTWTELAGGLPDAHPLKKLAAGAAVAKLPAIPKPPGVGAGGSTFAGGHIGRMTKPKMTDLGDMFKNLFKTPSGMKALGKSLDLSSMPWLKLWRMRL